MVAKLTDVAELAGVSPTTVSRVINKKGYLSEKTIQKVKDAILIRIWEDTTRKYLFSFIDENFKD